MKKLDIDVPKFVQKNNRYHLQVLASNLTDGNIKLFVQEVKHYHMHLKPYYKENNGISVEEVYKKLIG